MRPISTAYHFLPDSAVMWACAIPTAILATLWLAYDLRNLTKLRGADMTEPLNRDKRFGFLMGIVIGVVGIVGVLRYHWL
jgi:FtsH-binding integral membrane protein